MKRTASNHNFSLDYGVEEEGESLMTQNQLLKDDNVLVYYTDEEDYDLDEQD